MQHFKIHNLKTKNKSVSKQTRVKNMPNKHKNLDMFMKTRQLTLVLKFTLDILLVSLH